jgi:hypothetical protein
MEVPVLFLPMRQPVDALTLTTASNLKAPR